LDLKTLSDCRTYSYIKKGQKRQIDMFLLTTDTLQQQTLTPKIEKRLLKEIVAQVVNYLF
jgi:hypothetical protein